MKFTTTVKKNKKVWESIKKNLKAQKGKTVEVGFFDGNLHPITKQSIPQIAKWNEEGHYNGGRYSGTYTPPRPFFRAALNSFMKESFKTKYLAKVNQIALGRYTWDSLNKEMAEELKELIKKSITGWTTPSNSALTIKLKGFNNPLINTGTMLNSVKYRIKARSNG